MMQAGSFEETDALGEIVPASSVKDAFAMADDQRKNMKRLGQGDETSATTTSNAQGYGAKSSGYGTSTVGYGGASQKSQGSGYGYGQAGYGAPSPTKKPTKTPTKKPTKTPTSAPTKKPTATPTTTPTPAPVKLGRGSNSQPDWRKFRNSGLCPYPHKLPPRPCKKGSVLVQELYWNLSLSKSCAWVCRCKQAAGCRSLLLSAHFQGGQKKGASTRGSIEQMRSSYVEHYNRAREQHIVVAFI